MPWVSPHRWTLNDGTPNFGLLNQDLITNPATLRNANDAQVKVYRTTAVSVASDTHQFISWNAQSYEVTTGLWDSGDPTRLFAPTSGVYLLTVKMQWASSASGRRGCGYRVNGGGAEYDMQVNASSATSKQNGSDLIKLRTGDYVQVYAYQTSGVALNMTGGDEGNSSVTLTLLGSPTAAPPWTEPRTWATGEVLTPHLLNTEFSDNLANRRYFGGQAAKVSLLENQSITGGQRQILNWDVERWHVGSLWTGGSTFVSPIEAWYLLVATVGWRSEAGAAIGAIRGVGFSTNERRHDYDLHFQSGNTAGVFSNGKTIVRLRKDEALEVYAFQDSDQALTVRGGINGTRVAIAMIAA